MDLKSISWDNIEKLQDEMITFLLYKEGKSINCICRIRNISRETIEKHIIEAKIKIRSIKHKEKHIKKSLLDTMLELSKKERLKFINEAPAEKIKYLVEEIKDRYRNLKNPDDKVIAIWIIGELKNNELISLLIKDIIHYNGNVRRMVCSALGKINDKRAKAALHKALGDKKPQVRQYAAKALKNIGDKESIKVLSRIINDKYEKKYVINACEDATKAIEGRLELVE